MYTKCKRKMLRYAVFSYFKPKIESYSSAPRRLPTLHCQIIFGFTLPVVSIVVYLGHWCPIIVVKGLRILFYEHFRISKRNNSRFQKYTIYTES